jgi:hypothetical protein
MKLRMPIQLTVALGIILVGVGALGGEYVLVKWMPHHEQNVKDEVQRLLPYQNPGLGIDSMGVAAGIYGTVVDSPGGVRIYRKELLGGGPWLTITSQANPDGATDFSDQLLAQWQALGANLGILRYHFDHIQINEHNAAIVWQMQRNGQMLLTVHLISPERILQVECSPGVEDEITYTEACEATAKSIHLAGPPLPPPQEPQLYDLTPKKRPRP